MHHISLEGILKQYTTNTMNAMFTAMPGRVVGKPNLAEQRVDIQLLVNKVTTDDVSREHPILLNVPLVFQGSSSSQFSFPVRTGDTVLVVFSQRSIDRFKLGAKQPHTPADFRKYSRNDAMAIPGLFTFPDAVNNPSKRKLSHSTDDAVITHNIGTGAECEVRLKSSGDIIINAPGNKVQVNCKDAEIKASTSTRIDSPQTTVTGSLLVEGHLAFVAGMTGSGGSGGSVAQINGTLHATQDLRAGSISLVGHRHPGDSGGTTGLPF